MPQAIPFAISAIGAAVGASALVTTAISFAASALISSQQQRKAKKKERDAYNAAQVDRMANVMTSLAPRELVLGRVRKGGPVIFRGSSGQFNEILVVHIALAGHEIDAVETVYLNDRPVVIDGSGYVQDEPYYKINRVSAVKNQMGPAAAGSTVTLENLPIAGSVSAVTGQNEPVAVSVAGSVVTLLSDVTDGISISYQWAQGLAYARIRWDLGGGTAIADAVTKARFPGLWTDAHRGQGIAKLICEFVYNETAFPNGLPVVTALVRGAKVYDPRTSTTYWNANPSLLCRHVYQHEYFGKATVSAAEDARFIATANACDVIHNYTVDGVVDAEPLYAAHIVAPFGTPAQALLDDLTEAMAGMWAFSGAELFIRAGVYTAPVLSLTDADLAVIQRQGDTEEEAAITINVHRERAEKFNTINPRIWDGQQGFKQVALTPVSSAALVARDGQVLAQEIDLAAVTFAPQAQHVCGVMMRDARDPLTVELCFKMTAYAVELFDTVALTIPRYGWTAKTFMVVGRAWDPARGIIKLTLKETNAAIFTPDAAFLPQGYADNTAFPSPWDIEPPGTLVISSGTEDLQIASDGTIVTRVRVTWPTMTDERVLQGGHVEVQWCLAGTTRWNSIQVDGGSPELFILGVADGALITVRARTTTPLARSDWTVQQTHQVLGKTEPPDPPTGVSITQELVFFRPPADVDLAGVRVRALAGMVSSPVFSRGTDVIEGLVTISPARMERRLYGVQTIVVVAEDTSGNQSSPAYAVLDFGQPDVDSAIWVRDLASESFPGTYTGCSLSGGVVLADVNPSSNVYALDNVYGEPDVYATQYTAMTWQSVIIVPPYTGALTLDAAIAGNAPVVEYRISGDTITDIYAAADVYALDDVYGSASEWSLWPGAMEVRRGVPLEFRVSVSASTERGALSEFTLSLVMEEVAQTFVSITVDAGGTRLTPADGSPARNWVGNLRAVYGWPAVDGSGAVAGRVLDFSPTLGPLVQFVDNTGVAVTALGTLKVEGYSDE